MIKYPGDGSPRECRETRLLVTGGETEFRPI